jgi:hypothetical protein
MRLLSSGLTVREVHRQLGVGQTTLRNWLSRPERVAPSRDCPRCHGRRLDGRAYAYLLGLYLGDGHLAHGRKDVFRLDIACCDDWPGLTEAAARAVGAVMPANAVGRRKRQGCTMVCTTSKHLPCLFPQHGPGMKHMRKIALEPWQEEIVAEFTEEFIRGLIHSDGCRSMNRVRRPLKGGDRWYEYVRYTFVNESADIRELYAQALDHLGIAWKQSNRKTISVARREAVARLDEFVGPKY